MPDQSNYEGPINILDPESFAVATANAESKSFPTVDREQVAGQTIANRAINVGVTSVAGLSGTTAPALIAELLAMIQALQDEVDWAGLPKADSHANAPVAVGKPFLSANSNIWGLPEGVLLVRQDTDNG